MRRNGEISPHLVTLFKMYQCIQRTFCKIYASGGSSAFAAGILVLLCLQNMYVGNFPDVVPSMCFCDFGNCMYVSLFFKYPKCKPLMSLFERNSVKFIHITTLLRRLPHKPYTLAGFEPKIFHS
jgi:hypothetical protein